MNTLTPATSQTSQTSQTPQTPTPEAWLVRIATHKAEVPAFEAALLAFDATATVASYCPDDDNAPNQWLVEGYFSAPLAAHSLSSLGASAEQEPVWPQDWLALSQQGLEPLQAGRIRVVTEQHQKQIRPGEVGLIIPAGCAFGTGHHHTTWGCLMLLDRLAKHWRPKQVLDVGTGTGILALAASALWPCQVWATDIDPIAVDVARQNALRNGLALGCARNQLRMLCAPGVRHRVLKAHAPYDLLIANILAQPLVAMAGSLAQSLAPRGYLILSGLLESQKQRVLGAYQARGLRLVGQMQRSEWPSLLLRRY
jgi:ribosomal protein L11 methyltransferase